MKITEILNSHKTTLSFEVFPPKTDDKYAAVESAVTEIATYKPNFMSVTYGAGGGANNRFTASVASHIEKCGVTALAHLTCVNADRKLIARRLDEFSVAGVENVLALRGDIPADAPDPSGWPFRHASDLVSEIACRKSFCIGAACYPEGHFEAKSLDEDIENLKIKVDAGCDFLSTQMFFDNGKFYRFLDRISAVGIDIPVIAGIMPITSARLVKRSCELSGTVMPQNFLDIVERYGDEPECMKEAGIVYACEQIIDLLAHGVRSIHVFVMNKPETAEAIRRNLGHILPVHI